MEGVFGSSGRNSGILVFAVKNEVEERRAEGNEQLKIEM
jgi:hypothetical protein